MDWRWGGGPLLLGYAGAEGQVSGEGRSHPGNDVRFESGIQGCQMKARSPIICKEGAAACAS